MSHNIKKRDIQTGIEMAWHKLTNVVSKITRDNCGILYPMAKRPLYLLDDTGKPILKQIPVVDDKGKETGEFQTVSASDHYSIVSLDDNLPIGGPIMGGYELISNGQMFDMIEEALAGTSHEIVSIGSIGNREKVFASIKLSGSIVAAGRETQGVLNVLWGHGGKFGVTARSGFTVVVCQNTFNATLREKADFKLNVKHTSGSIAKIQGMAKAIDAHFGVVSEFKAAMDSLASQTVTEASAKEIFAGFIVREDEIEEVSTRSANQINRLGELFKTGKGNRGENFADVFNAFTDYYSHESSGGDDKFKQFASSEFGSGNRAKSEAFDLLTGETVPGMGDLAEVSARGNRVLQLV